MDRDGHTQKENDDSHPPPPAKGHLRPPEGRRGGLDQILLAAPEGMGPADAQVGISGLQTVRQYISVVESPCLWYLLQQLS